MSSPGVFGLPHLSEDAVAAFADGVLSPSAEARAQRHCRECGECADAVRGQRETAMMLRTAPAPALPSGLLDRLAGLPMSASLPPPSGGLPTAVGADGMPVFIANSAREQPPEPPPESGPPDRSAQFSAGAAVHRRSVLPMSVLASAAAVVAAGTFGGHAAALQGAADRVTPAPAVTLAGTSLQRSELGQNLRDPAEPNPAAGLFAGPLSGFRPSVGSPFTFTPALRTAPVRDAGAASGTGAVPRTGSAASFGLPAGTSAAASGQADGSRGGSTGSTNSSDASSANRQSAGVRVARAAGAGTTSKPAASATVDRGPATSAP